MADDFEALSAFLKRQGASIRTGVSKVVQQVAITALREVVQGTPVDKGKARSNWLVTVGNEDETTIVDPHAPGSKLGIDETANAEETIRLGEAVVATLKPGQTVYVQNNVPYIETLNAGSSAQAPPMFVETAVQAAVENEPNARIVEDG